MKNKTQLSNLYLPVIKSVSVNHLSVDKWVAADTDSVSKTAIFRPALIQILYTSIDLCHRHPVLRAGDQDQKSSVQLLKNTGRVILGQIVRARS